MNNVQTNNLKNLTIYQLAELAKVRVLTGREARKEFIEYKNDSDFLKKNYFFFVERGLLLTLNKARKQLIYEIQLKQPKRTPAKIVPKTKTVKTVVGNLALKGKQTISYFSGIIQVLGDKLQAIGDLLNKKGRELYLIIWRYIYCKKFTNKVQSWEKALRKFLKTQILDKWSFDECDDAQIDFNDNRLNLIAQVREVVY